jgi:hypothetical protein
MSARACFVFLILLSHALASCNYCSPGYTGYGEPVFYSYVQFMPGSVWVYKEKTSNLLDTLTLRSINITPDIYSGDDESCYGFTGSEYVQNTFHSSLYNRDEVYDFYRDPDHRACFIYERRQDRTEYSRFVFIQPGGNNERIHHFRTYDSMRAGNNIYFNVLEIRAFNPNYTPATLARPTPSHAKKVWYCQNIGAIRMKMIDSTEWELISYTTK